MKDDQWFNPGDKVMRVAYSPQLGAIPGLRILPLVPETDFGNVLCVEICWEDRGVNRVKFVGIELDSDHGWRAACFRRVSEIRLCVEATKRSASPVHAAKGQA